MPEDRRILFRNSNIELLKILSMLGIVLGHCRPISTTYWTNTYFSLGQSTNDPELFVLNALGYLGAYGNAIFIICSAWFLTDSDCVKTKKINTMIVDSWFVSMFFLFVAILFGFNPGIKEIIRSVFPTMYGVTWFVGCYILFYIIHPFLNIILNNARKDALLRLNVFLFILYFVLYFVFPAASLYFNYFLGFCCIYLFVGYAKKYTQRFIDNTKLQILLFTFNLVTMLAVLLCLNFVGLKIAFVSNKFGYLSYFNDCLIFCGSFAIFNVFRTTWGGGRTNLLIGCLP